MATGLGQLLVDEGVLKPERLEDAYQRQVLYGGQLDTVLLEMGLVDETRLLQMLGRRFQLPVAHAEAIDSVSVDVLRLLPRRLAERYRLVPLALERRQLHVACCRPLALDVADDIGFMLSLFLVPHITSELRIHFALFKHYGVELPARDANLLAQLGVDVDSEQTPAAKIQRATDDEPTEHSGDLREDKATAWVVDEPARSAPPPPPDDAHQESHGDWRAVPASEAGIDADEIAFERPAESLSALLTGDGTDALNEDPPKVKVPKRLRERLLEDLQAETADRQRRREKVPWSIDDASAELALSRSRDDIVEVLLRFAYRRLEQVAMLVLMNDHFAGWDAIGSGVEERIESLRLHIGSSPALSTVEKTGAHTLGPLAADDPLCEALCDTPPRTALLMPLFVRDRLLGVLYGDNAQRGIDGDVLSELQMLMPKLRLAFEVVILRRKQAASQQLEDFELDIEVVAELEPGDEAEAIAAELRLPSDALPPPVPAPGPQDVEPDSVADEDILGEDVVAEEILAEEIVEKKTAASDNVAIIDDTQDSPPTSESLIIDEELLSRTRTDGELALQVHAQMIAQTASPKLMTLIAMAGDEATSAPQRHEALMQLEATPVVSLCALAQTFPGHLSVNLFGNYDRRPEGKELSAVCEALLRLGPSVIAPVLAAELKSQMRERRAVAASMMMDLDVPAARGALLDCLLDPEARIALLVAESCTQHGRQELDDDAALRIEQALRSSDEDLRFRGIRACRACLARQPLPALIDILGGGDRDLAEDAGEALREITKQDLGTSVRRWRKWINEHGNKRRIEWLLAGLDHRNRELRQSSQYELEAISGQLLDYRYDAPRGKRDLGRARWQEWWEKVRDERRWP